jgi:histidine triad (HIT) family protein
MVPTMNECIFCKIVRGDIPAAFALQDSEFVAFPDINPKAPVHLLVMPRAHVRSLNEVAAQDAGFGQRLLAFVASAAASVGVGQNGYRVIINNGPDAGQEVDHLHIHVLGGRELGDLT